MIQVELEQLNEGMWKTRRCRDIKLTIGVISSQQDFFIGLRNNLKSEEIQGVNYIRIEFNGPYDVGIFQYEHIRKS